MKLLPIAQNIKESHKLIHHKWNKINDNKLKHAKCERCECEKYYEDRFGKVIFVDRFGKTYPHSTPPCVIPNTKMSEDLEYQHATNAAPKKNKYQIGIKLNEQIHRIKSIIKVITEDNFTPDNLGDDWMDISSEERAERLFGKQTNLETQFSKIVDDKLSSDDEIEAYKWSTYNAVLIELEKLGEHSLIKEIEYWITDGKDPYNVFDDATKKTQQTPEINRLRQVMHDFRDIESGHEPTIDDFLNPTDER